MTECQICVFSWIIIFRPKKGLMVMMMTDSDNRGRDGIEMRPTDQNLKLNSLKTHNSNKIKFRLHEIQLDVSSRQKSSQILFREWFRARESKNDVASLVFFSSLRVRPRDGLCYLHFSTLTCFLGPDMTTIKHSEEF